MKKRRSFSPDYQEDYLMNNSEFQPGWSGIRVHSFCHSLLLPNFTSDEHTRPFILVSLILSGEENYLDSEGDRILRKPGFFSIIDLNRNKASAHRRRHSLERYFVLFHVNRFLRGVLDDLFPAGFPKGQAPNPARLKHCFEDIRKVLRKPGETDNILLGAMGFRLLCEAAEQFSPHSDLPDSLNRALQFIDNRLCDPELTRTAVAEDAAQRIRDQLGGVRSPLPVQETVVVIVSGSKSEDAVAVFEPDQPGAGIPGRRLFLGPPHVIGDRTGPGRRGADP